MDGVVGLGMGGRWLMDNNLEEKGRDWKRMISELEEEWSLRWRFLRRLSTDWKSGVWSQEHHAWDLIIASVVGSSSLATSHSYCIPQTTKLRIESCYCNTTFFIWEFVLLPKEVLLGQQVKDGWMSSD